EDQEIEVLKVDNSRVRTEQLAKLDKLRAERDEDACQAALARLTEAASGGASSDMDNNLLALAIDAARAYASIGEISDALEKVYGRHKAEIKTLSGVYRQ